jgi:hypothetical protein
MRSGSRVLVVGVLLFVALCSRAFAADTLSVYVDNNSIALGSGTQIAAHSETDEAYGGGHVAFKYKPADQDCKPTFAEDDGADATGDQPKAIAAGVGTADVAGAPIQLDVGNWRVCGWLLDDANGGTVVAVASTVVEVVAFRGSISETVKRVGHAFQFNFSYSTSAPGRLYASLQRAAKQCSRNPTNLPKGSTLLVSRGGRYVGSDGGLGRSVDLKRIAPGRWRVCAWLQSDFGSVGPATKTFVRPRPARRGARAAG